MSSKDRKKRNISPGREDLPQNRQSKPKTVLPVTDHTDPRTRSRTVSPVITNRRNDAYDPNRVRRVEPGHNRSYNVDRNRSPNDLNRGTGQLRDPSYENHIMSPTLGRPTL